VAGQNEGVEDVHPAVAVNILAKGGGKEPGSFALGLVRGSHKQGGKNKEDNDGRRRGERTNTRPTEDEAAAGPAAGKALAGRGDNGPVHLGRHGHGGVEGRQVLSKALRGFEFRLATGVFSRIGHGLLSTQLSKQVG
jgi:hypothetical protein